MSNKYVSLRSIAKKIYCDSDTDTQQNFENFNSSISKKYQQIMKLLGIDHKIYKDSTKEGYNIPKTIEPILIFFFKELTKNKVLKEIKKTKPNDDRLTKEMIKFFYNTELLSQKEKESALYELATTNKNLYDNISSILLEDTKQDIENIKNLLKYDRSINFINFEERIMLIIKYKQKIKNLLDELIIAKEILDGKSLEDFTYNLNLESFILEEKIDSIIQEAEIELNDRKSFEKESLTEEEIKNVYEIVKSIDLKFNNRK